MVARVQSPGFRDGRKVGQKTFTPTPPKPSHTGGSQIRSDYRYMNDDVFSLASILNFVDSWFEVWSGEDFAVWGQSHISNVL